MKFQQMNLHGKEKLEKEKEEFQLCLEMNTKIQSSITQKTMISNVNKNEINLCENLYIYIIYKTRNLNYNEFRTSIVTLVKPLGLYDGVTTNTLYQIELSEIESKLYQQ